MVQRTVSLTEEARDVMASLKGPGQSATGVVMEYLLPIAVRKRRVRYDKKKKTYVTSRR